MYMIDKACKVTPWLGAQTPDDMMTGSATPQEVLTAHNLKCVQLKGRH